ncbi:MAG: trypsin-like peptidase domain-containing protein [Flavobacteriales bacterium]
MSHYLGRRVDDGRTVDQNAPLLLTPGAGPNGPALFVMLHFDRIVLNGGARLSVDLGYGTDVFTSGSGTDLWTRPIDTANLPITIRITGGTGSARLFEYGSGERAIPPGHAPGTDRGSLTNPDVFLHGDPYTEPTYETRLECNPGFAWRNADCSLPLISNAARQRAAAATGIIVEVHDDHVSSCSGTLIGADLFLTARHCLTDPSGADRLSASVSFDYATACDGTRPAGHVTRFFKVLGEVASGSPPNGTEPPPSIDWVVVRLNAAPGALPAPIPLRDAALMVGETIFTMHHPNGAAKKTQDGSFSNLGVNGFDFAGGSSGSGLFDSSGQLVGAALSQGSGCSVTYAPVSAVKATLNNPPAPPAPLDVMIVFDKSGSMASAAPPTGRTKLLEAQDAASLFVNLVRDGAGDRLGLVTFSSTAALDAPLTLAAAAKPTLVGMAPFTSGLIGAIAAGGSTSIGAGIGVAQFAIGAGTNRAILLLTDGLQNTLPMIAEVEPFLGSTKLNVIGLGSDADIDAPLLHHVASSHGGHFTRALDGIALKKFFGVSFGNIFESGALIDPDHSLRAAQAVSSPHTFRVCGEERITVVLGWDDPATPLNAHILTPTGKPINARKMQPVRGRTWAFWRIPLPHAGERDGEWSFTVDRVPTGGEFPPAPTDVRYFFLVICAGGPKLMRLPTRKRIYTGDVVHPMVGLHYANGTVPHNAQVELIVESPTVALGELTTQAGLRSPSGGADPVNGFHATLQAIAHGHGGMLPVHPRTTTLPLFDDGDHADGALEADGFFNNPLKDLTRVEGTYNFRAVATFGNGCKATREAMWSVHVEPGIDPGRTHTSVIDVSGGTGNSGTIVIVPADVHGNPLGPGRGDRFDVTPLPGVVIDGPVKDKGDGSYQIPVSWGAGAAPGVVVKQPDRDPVPLVPGGTFDPPGAPDCTPIAGKLLDCLGLHGADASCVRVTSVNIAIDLHDKKCNCHDKKPHDGKCRCGKG